MAQSAFKTQANKILKHVEMYAYCDISISKFTRLWTTTKAILPACSPLSDSVNQYFSLASEQAQYYQKQKDYGFGTGCIIDSYNYYLKAAASILLAMDFSSLAEAQKDEYQAVWLPEIKRHFKLQ